MEEGKGNDGEEEDDGGGGAGGGEFLRLERMDGTKHFSPQRSRSANYLLPPPFSSYVPPSPHSHRKAMFGLRGPSPCPGGSSQRRLRMKNRSRGMGPYHQFPENGMGRGHDQCQATHLAAACSAVPCVAVRSDPCIAAWFPAATRAFAPCVAAGNCQCSAAGRRKL